MTVLEDLWYGNIRPVENFVDGNMEYKGLLRLVSKTERHLKVSSLQNNSTYWKNSTSR